jgi:uncharacterized iron-regulated membrane protein
MAGTSQRQVIRHILVKLHRIFGLSAAAFIVIAAVTGSMLAFKYELDPILNPELLQVKEVGPNLSANPAVARVKQAFPDADAAALAVFRQPGRSMEIYTSPAADVPEDRAVAVPYVVYIHPQTGEILGKRFVSEPLSKSSFFDWILDLHHTLKLPAEIGIWFLGILAIFWIFDNLFGLFLSFPPGQPLAKALQIKWRGKAYRLNCDIHRVLGLVLLPVLLMLAITSVALNLPYQIAYPVVRAVSDVTINQALTPRVGPRPNGPVLSWDAAIRQAEALVPGVYPNRIRLDTIDIDSARGVYRASYLTPADIDPDTGRSRFHFDAYTGKLLHTEPPQGNSAGDTFLAWMFPLHGGAAFGLIGRTIIFLTGIALAVITISGLVIWWKKRKGRVGRSNKASKQALKATSMLQ